MGLSADVNTGSNDGLTEGTTASNRSSLKTDDELPDKKPKSKKRVKEQEDIQANNSQFELDEQALIDQMKASNMVAEAIIEKEKENQVTI